jgi:hypothetical protein
MVMSENAAALDVIRQEAGEDAFRRICARLCGDRVLFPHKRHGLPKAIRIVGYLRAGYDVKHIARSIGCSLRHVQAIRRREGESEADALQTSRNADTVSP